MKFSLQLQYAIGGIFDLAYHGGHGPTQIRVIGERQGIPLRYLEQIFQRLRKAGLVKAKRGPGGGYVLARSSESISVAEVMEAVEGSLVERPKTSGMSSEEGGSGSGADFLWPFLSERLVGVLAQLSLAEICRLAAREGVPRLGSTPQDYQI